MISYLLDTLDDMEGTLLYFGIKDVKLLNTISSISKIKSTGENEYNDNFKWNKTDYIICNYDAVKGIDNFVKTAMNNTNKKIYIYGENIKLTSLQRGIYDYSKFTYLVRRDNGSILIVDMEKYAQKKPSLFMKIMDWLKVFGY